MDRIEPQAGDAQLRQVVQPTGQSAEIPTPVPVGVAEQVDLHAVDDRLPIPTIHHRTHLPHIQPTAGSFAAPHDSGQDSAVEGCQRNAATSVDLLPACRRGRTVHPPAPRAPTARAMTRREVTNAAVACTPMRIFARLVNGIVSVGLNALEFVVDRYK